MQRGSDQAPLSENRGSNYSWPNLKTESLEIRNLGALALSQHNPALGGDSRDPSSLIHLAPAVSAFLAMSSSQRRQVALPTGESA